jgi:hypothetical protein
MPGRSNRVRTLAAVARQRQAGTAHASPYASSVRSRTTLHPSASHTHAQRTSNCRRCLW